MSHSTFRALDIVRALAEVQQTIHRRRNEVDDSLTRNERGFFFRLGQSVRVTCPLVLDEVLHNHFENRVGEVRSINFGTGDITLWVCSINDVEYLLVVPAQALSEIEYDSTGDDAYPSEWSSDDGR